MIQKRSITIIIFVALFCLILFWSVNRSSNEAKPLPDSDEILDQSLSDQASIGSALLVRDGRLNKKLAERFRLTTGFIEKGQDERAIAELNEIISEQPNAIEPYINLASIYAKSNKIDQATETLIKAIDVNENTALLFKGLQKIYAAQAALAYQRALEIDSDSEELTVNLPLIDTLMVDKPNNVEQDLISDNEGLQQQLDENSAELKSLRQSLAQAIKDKNELVVTASQIKRNDKVLSEQNVEGSGLLPQQQVVQPGIDELAKAHEQELNELQVEFDAQVLALQRQIDLQTAMLIEVDLKPSEPILTQNIKQTPDAKKAEIKKPGIKQTAIATLEPSVSSGKGIKEKQKTIAINLVKAWARSWASQDVDTYVSHYEYNFRPPSGVNNQKWREQRQAQLTNKSFINVEVDGFIVEQRGDQLLVTFSQHYKSNDVENTVVKRLIFKKKSADWSQAKIVQEQLISS